MRKFFTPSAFVSCVLNLLKMSNNLCLNAGICW